MQAVENSREMDMERVSPVRRPAMLSPRRAVFPQLLNFRSAVRLSILL
jgi:hypothetical protein